MQRKRNVDFFLTSTVPSDEFDGSEGFVHVPKSRVEAEVRHGPESGRFTGLETNIVFSWRVWLLLSARDGRWTVS